MSEPERNESHEASMEAVLNALREACPAPGMEDRLLRRLASQERNTSRQRQRRWMVLAVPAALAACVVGTVSLRYYQSVTSLPVMKAGTTVHAAPYVPALLAPLQTPQTLRSNTRTLHLRMEDTRVRTMDSTAPGKFQRIVAATSGVPKQRTHDASFPAPEMPLTEQERLLVQIAHRNDPVQVAILDSHERDLILARERAESKRFFSPRPLPPELQQEIDAAVRAQYDLPQPAPSRSLP